MRLAAFISDFQAEDFIADVHGPRPKNWAMADESDEYRAALGEAPAYAATDYEIRART